VYLPSLALVILFGNTTFVFSEYRLILSHWQVHAILKDLVRKAINETHELKQFPTLRVEVGNAAFESFYRMRDESKKNTLKLVDMECSYLTVDFFRKLPQDVEKGGNPSHSIFDRYNDSYLRRIGQTVLSYVNMVCATLRNSIPKSIVYCQVLRQSAHFSTTFSLN
jgi:hypothetical protein